MARAQTRALRLTAALIAIGTSALTPSAAFASAPTRDGHYYGFQASETDIASVLDVSAELLISPNGRRFEPGSYVRLIAVCSRPIGIRKARLGRAVTIGRRGRFSLVGTAGPLRYRLKGLFRSPDYARITYTARQRGRPCRVGDDPAALYLNGEPPFSDCRNQEAQTVSSSPDGRVFERYRLDNDQFFPHQYACAYAFQFGPVLLGRNYDDERVAQAHVRGPYVAYASLGCGVSGCGARIVEKYLFGGATVKTAAAAFGNCCINTEVGSLVLKQNGSMAWITRTIDLSAPIPLHTEVYAFDEQGWRMLDSGKDIERDSLSLDEASSTLRWVNGGVTKTDTLH